MPGPGVDPEASGFGVNALIGGDTSAADRRLTEGVLQTELQAKYLRGYKFARQSHCTRD